MSGAVWTDTMLPDLVSLALIVRAAETLLQSNSALSR